MSQTDLTVTEGTLLGGKLRYRQFAAGHRSGFEPVLLAAAVPARAGDSVLEAGTGAGAGLLCLAHRVPGITGLGLEIDPSLADLADKNFIINGFNTIAAVAGDAAHPPHDVFAHIFANPPWHGDASTVSPDAARARAHHAPPALVAAWISALSPRLKPRGTFTLILPAAALSDAIMALRAHDLGGRTVFPFWPRAGQPAKFFIIAARKGSKAPDKILPGIVLHDAAGVTREADGVLRDGEAIEV